MLPVAEQVGERLDGAHGEGRDPADGRLKVAWRAASYAAWNAASSASHRRSVFSPMPQRAAAFPIVGSDKSARIACSRTAAVLAPWPAPDFRSSAVICGRLRRVGRFGVIQRHAVRRTRQCGRVSQVT